MDETALREWLSEPRPALVAAVADGVRAHAAALRAVGIDFYGYALLPGEPYDIGGLVAVANTEADLKVDPADGQYPYDRYCVDEWAHWERDRFAAADTLLAEANARFAALHARDDDDLSMDEFQVAHSDALLDAVVRGLESAKAAGAFGDREPFLVVWISDSGHPILVESVRRLNPEPVARAFEAVVG